MKKKFAVLTLAAGLLAAGGLAQAGTTYGGYDVIVPKLNGNAFTPQQTKSTTGASADLKVSILGKALDARAHSYSGGTGPWVRIATVGGHSNCLIRSNQVRMPELSSAQILLNW
jgi:hypothetical protein